MLFLTHQMKVSSIYTVFKLTKMPIQIPYPINAMPSSDLNHNASKMIPNRIQRLPITIWMMDNLKQITSKVGGSSWLLVVVMVGVVGGGDGWNWW